MQIENEQLHKLLTEKGELVEKARELAKQFEETKEPLNKLKQQIVELVEAEIVADLTEDEILQSVDLEDGKIVGTIVTREEFVNEAIKEANAAFDKTKKLSEEDQEETPSE